MNKSKHLVWLDLEMTGLDVNRDVILEIAVIITDEQLNIVAHGPDLILSVRSEREDVVGQGLRAARGERVEPCGHLDLASMDPFVYDMHAKSGLLAKVAKSQITLDQAQEQVLDFIKQYGEPKTMPLCGNSIWQDKLFLIKYMPKLINYLHYRVIDVSTVKELVKGWYSALEFKKNKAHRALLDIEESINELKHYREKYFK